MRKIGRRASGFAEWEEGNSADRHILSCHPGNFCALQVFYLRPHQCWYLICQAADEAWGDPPYRLKGLDKYLTPVEARDGHGWRYYKAHLADLLDGRWEPLAADRDSAFASMRNIMPIAQRWTDAVSHAELLRTGRDEISHTTGTGGGLLPKSAAGPDVIPTAVDLCRPLSSVT